MKKPHKEMPRHPAPTDKDKRLITALDEVVAAGTAQRHAQIKHLEDGTIRHASGAVAKPITDGWANVMTGLGTHQDKRSFNYASWQLSITEMEAEDLYSGDRTARRIVELMPHEATREGIEWKDPKKSDFLADEYLRLNVWETVHDACVFARLYGGSGILLNDGKTPLEKLGEPLDPNAKIESLVALTRWELWAYATQLQRDISQPDFGRPVRYRIFPRMTFGQTAIEVHASRIIRFDGVRLPRLQFIRNNFWHDSVLTALLEPLGDYKMAAAAMANTLHDFRLFVVKLKGLVDGLNAGQDKLIAARLQQMNSSRSVLGALVIDGDDDATFQAGSLAGVPDVFDRVKERLQAETDIPHNILFNEGPGQKGGLGGKTGNNETEVWYNTVHAWQENSLRPRLVQLNRVLLGQQGGQVTEVEEHEFEFKTLWQEDDAEEAKTELAHAQADQIYLNLGVRTPEAVQLERFPDEAKLMPAAADFVKPQETVEPETTPEDQKP